jgi:hypothetical protein
MLSVLPMQVTGAVQNNGWCHAGAQEFGSSSPMSLDRCLGRTAAQTLGKSRLPALTLP